MIKLPFFYNKALVNSFTFSKILNYQYYTKFLYINLENTTNSKFLEVIELQIKKQKRKKKKKVAIIIPKELKRKYSIIRSEIFFDLYNAIEYLKDDFLLSRLNHVETGFTFNVREKYFVNKKALGFDFKEKMFSFQQTKHYLDSVYLSFNNLLSKNLTYKTIMPIRPVKGGYFVLGFNLLGFMPADQILYTKALNSKIFLNSCSFTQTLSPFFEAYFKVSFFETEVELDVPDRHSRNFIYFLAVYQVPVVTLVDETDSVKPI